MKKLMIIIGLILVVVVGALSLPTKQIEYDYLRLHIRANSNEEVDQKVKYEIKDKIVQVLAPFLCNIESKEKAIKIVSDYSSLLKSECVNILKYKIKCVYKVHYWVSYERLIIM